MSQVSNERDRRAYRSRTEAAKLRIAGIGEGAFLTTAEAAAYLNYCESHFRALVRAGKVPQPIRVGGKLLWRQSLLDAHMNALAIAQGVIPPNAA